MWPAARHAEVERQGVEERLLDGLASRFLHGFVKCLRGDIASITDAFAVAEDRAVVVADIHADTRGVLTTGGVVAGSALRRIDIERVTTPNVVATRVDPPALAISNAGRARKCVNQVDPYPFGGRTRALGFYSYVTRIEITRVVDDIAPPGKDVAPLACARLGGIEGNG